MVELDDHLTDNSFRVRCTVCCHAWDPRQQQSYCATALAMLSLAAFLATQAPMLTPSSRVCAQGNALTCPAGGFPLASMPPPGRLDNVMCYVASSPNAVRDLAVPIIADSSALLL